MFNVALSTWISQGPFVFFSLAVDIEPNQPWSSKKVLMLTFIPVMIWISFPIWTIIDPGNTVDIPFGPFDLDPELDFEPNLNFLWTVFLDCYCFSTTQRLISPASGFMDLLDTHNGPPSMTDL